jgi:hypothetical protein
MASQAFRAIAALLLAASAAQGVSVGERSVVGDPDTPEFPTTSTVPTCISWFQAGATCAGGSTLVGSLQTLFKLYCDPAAAGNCQATCCRPIAYALPTTTPSILPEPDMPEIPTSASSVPTSVTDSPPETAPLLAPRSIDTPSTTCTRWFQAGAQCASGTTVAASLQTLSQLYCDPAVNCQAACCKLRVYAII